MRRVKDPIAVFDEISKFAMLRCAKKAKYK